MSDQRVGGPLSALASVVGEERTRHQNASPVIQHENYAFFGSFIIGSLGYVAVTLGPYAGHFSFSSKLIFVSIFALGVMLLRMGWQGTRGKRRNQLGALMSLAMPAFGCYVIVNYLPGILQIFWFRAIAAGLIAAYGVRLWLDVRGPGTGAYNRVAADIDRNEWRW